jgi:hypothetical protein
MSGHFKPIAHGSYKGWQQHVRRGERPLSGTCGCREEFLEYRKAHQRMGDCDICPRTNVIVVKRESYTLCKGCYWRWWYDGFTGVPSPPFPTALEKAEEYRETIFRCSAQEAGRRIGVTPRTVWRWRRLLREAA